MDKNNIYAFDDAATDNLAREIHSLLPLLLPTETTQKTKFDLLAHLKSVWLPHFPDNTVDPDKLAFAIMNHAKASNSAENG